MRAPIEHEACDYLQHHLGGSGGDCQSRRFAKRRLKHAYLRRRQSAGCIRRAVHARRPQGDLPRELTGVVLRCRRLYLRHFTGLESRENAPSQGATGFYSPAVATDIGAQRCVTAAIPQVFGGGGEPPLGLEYIIEPGALYRQRRCQQGPRFPDFADDGVTRNVDVSELDPLKLLSGDAGDRRYMNTLRVHVDEEERDAGILTAVLRGPRGGKSYVGDMALQTEYLGAVEPIAVSFDHGSRAQRGQVRARSRLRV